MLKKLFEFIERNVEGFNFDPRKHSTITVYKNGQYKVEPQISSKVNEENKKKVVKGENPVKEAMASDNNETLSDATFMF